MKIQEVYAKYKIMPQLQLHQLRVAGVASIITDNYQGEIDKHAIVSAALLHDMGNIIKFDLTLFPESLEPEGLDYWQSIKDKFIQKYGNDEHEATYKIIDELGVDSRIEKIVQRYGFSKGKKTSEISDFNVKIAAYSDHRVSVVGVESLMDRFKEKMNRSDQKHTDYMSSVIPYWGKIENQIFDNCRIDPDDITNEKVEPLNQKLKEYKVN